MEHVREALEQKIAKSAKEKIGQVHPVTRPENFLVTTNDEHSNGPLAAIFAPFAAFCSPIE
jgi:hypothetical protein